MWRDDGLDDYREMLRATRVASAQHALAMAKGPGSIAARNDPLANSGSIFARQYPGFVDQFNDAAMQQNPASNFYSPLRRGQENNQKQQAPTVIIASGMPDIGATIMGKVNSGSPNALQSLFSGNYLGQMGQFGHPFSVSPMPDRRPQKPFKYTSSTDKNGVPTFSDY